MNLTYWINTLNKIFEFQSLQSVFGVYLLCQKEFFFFLDNVRLHGAQHPISLWLLKRTLYRQSTRLFETKHDFETQVFYFLKSDTVSMCSEHINKCCASAGIQYVFDTDTSLILKYLCFVGQMPLRKEEGWSRKL